jgi:hypothetical protein
MRNKVSQKLVDERQRVDFRCTGAPVSLWMKRAYDNFIGTPHAWQKRSCFCRAKALSLDYPSASEISEKSSGAGGA